MKCNFCSIQNYEKVCVTNLTQGLQLILAAIVGPGIIATAMSTIEQVMFHNLYKGYNLFTDEMIN